MVRIKLTSIGEVYFQQALEYWQVQNQWRRTELGFWEGHLQCIKSVSSLLCLTGFKHSSNGYRYGDWGLPYHVVVAAYQQDSKGEWKVCRQYCKHTNMRVEEINRRTLSHFAEMTCNLYTCDCGFERKEWEWA